MYVLFDIGGTNTRIAVSEDLHTYGEPIKFKTPKTYREGLGAVTTAIDTLIKSSGITAIAGGIRGPLNHERTGIVSETKLVDWVGRNIVKDLHEHYHVPVRLENDTALVGLGEAVFGAGRGYDIVAYHTVSTGVGGARFVHGAIDVVSLGFEPGHQELDLDRSILGHHIPHTLENLVSGTALEKRRGVKPYEIPQDDPVWDELASYLAHGLKNTIVYWSPEVIVLGGSMMIGDPRIYTVDVERYTKKVLGDLMPCPPIVDALLKDEGGLFGAMALLTHLEHPHGR
jgi:predicted NBD/HSP70 family sugar kinase